MPVGSREDWLNRGQNQSQGFDLSNPYNLGGTAADFNKLHSDVNRALAQRKTPQKSNEREEANFFDKMSSHLMKGGEQLFNLGGFQDNFTKRIQEGRGFDVDPVGTTFDLALTLPGSMIGSGFKGLGQWHEVFTGRDVQSMDDKGTISAEPLTVGQRMWEAVDAATNMGGGGIGGSGRVLGLGGRALKASLGESSKVSKALDMVMPAGGRGILADAADKAFKDSGKSSKRVAGFGAQFLADTIQEGHEEFVQTFAEKGRAGEDFTKDVWDEAITSGMYGALGGAIMGGTAGAAHLSLDLAQDVSSQQEKEEPKSGDINKGPTIDNVMQYDQIKDETTLDDRFVPASVEKYRQGLDKRETEQQGAVAMTVMSSPQSKGMNVDDIFGGYTGIKTQYLRSNEEGRQMWSKIIGMKPEELDKVFIEMNDTDAMIALNNSLKHNYDTNKDNCVVAILRNPGTDDSTWHYVYLREIVEGSNVHMHPFAAQLGNGDIDSDMKTLYSPANKPNGLFASQLALNDRGHAGNFNWDYFPRFDVNRETDKLFREELEKVFYKYFRDEEIGLGYLTQDQIDYYTKILAESLLDGFKGKVDNKKDPTANKFDKFAKALTDLQFLIEQRDKELNLNIRPDIVSDVINAVYEVIDVTNTIQDITQDGLDKMMKELDDDVAQIDKKLDSEKEVGHDSGSVGMAQVVYALAQVFGRVGSIAQATSGSVAYREGKGNAVFRDQTTDKINIASRVIGAPEILAQVRSFGVDSFENMMITAFKLARQGECTEENIESIITGLIIDRFEEEVPIHGERRFGGTNSLNFDDTIYKFAVAYDYFIRIRNNAIQKYFYNKEHAAVGTFEKPTLFKYDNNGNRLDDLNRDAAEIKFLEFFGGRSADSLIKLPSESKYSKSKTSLEALITEVRLNDLEQNAVIYQLQPEAQKALRALTKAKKAQRTAIANSLKTELASLGRIDTEGVLRDQDMKQALYISETWIHLTGEDFAIRNGLASAKDLFGSKYNRGVFSGTNDLRYNTFLVYMLDAKYGNLVMYYTKYEETGEDLYYQLALGEAAKNVTGDTLSNSIYLELKNNGTCHLLEMMMDTSSNSSFATKEAMYLGMFETKGIEPDDLLLSAALRNPGESGYTEVKTKTLENLKAVNLSLDTEYSKCVSESEALLKELEKLQDAQDMLLFEDYCMSHVFELNEEIPIAVSMDSTGNHLKADEKGIAIANATMLNTMLRSQTFGYDPTLADELSMPLNSYNPEVAANNKIALLGVFFQGESIDVRSGEEEFTVDLEYLLGHPPTGTEIEGKPGKRRMSRNDLRELLTTCPALVRLFMPHTITPSLSRDEDGSIVQTPKEGAKGNIKFGFNEFIKGRGDIARQEFEHERTVIKWELLKQPFTYAIITGSVNLDATGALDGQRVSKSFEELVDAVYWDRAHRNGGHESDRDQEIYTELLRSFDAKLRLAAGKSGSKRAAKLAQEIIASGSLMTSPNAMGALLAGNIKEQVLTTLNENVVIDDNEETLEEFLSREDLGQFGILIKGLAAANSGKITTTRDLENVISKLSGTYSPDTIDDVVLSNIVRDINAAVVATVGRDRMKAAILTEFKNALAVSGIDLSTSSEFFTSLNDVCDEIYEKFEKEVDPNAFMTFEDLEDLDEFYKKAEKILRDPANEIKGTDGTETLLKQIRDIKNAEEAESLRIRVNNVVLKTRINALNSFLKMNVSSDFFLDAEIVLESYQQLFNSIRTNPEIKTTHADLIGKHRPHCPIIDLTSNTYHATNAVKNAKEGQIGSQVANNGMMMAREMVLSTLPHNKECNAPGKETEWKEIKDQIAEMGRTRIDIEIDGKIVSRNIANLYRDQFDDNTKVFVHDSRYCRCGFCKKHFGLPGNRFRKGYIGPASALIHLSDSSQEQMNLKLKKFLDLLTPIVPDIALRIPKIKQLVIDCEGLSFDEIRESVVGNIHGYDFEENGTKHHRDGIVDMLTLSYTTIVRAHGLEETDISSEELREIAIALNPRVKLVGANGETCFISLEHLYDDEHFKTVIDTKLGGNLASVETAPLTIDQLIQRLGKAQSKAIKEAEASGQKYSVKEMQETTWKALNDWDDYSTKPMQREKFLAMVGAKPLSGRTSIIPAGHYSAKQILEDGIFSKPSYGSNSGMIDYEQRSSIKTEKNEPALKHTAEFLGKAEDKIDYVIVKYTDDKEYVGSYYGTKRHEQATRLNHNGDKFFKEKSSAAVIMTNNQKEIINAIYGNKYDGYSYLWVPYESLPIEIKENDMVIVETNVLYEKKIARIDLDAISAAAGQNGFSFGYNFFDQRQVGLVSRDEFNRVTGDSNAVANDEYFEVARLFNEQSLEVDIEAFSGINEPHHVTKEEMPQVAQKILDEWDDDSKLPNCLVPMIKSGHNGIAMNKLLKKWLTDLSEGKTDGISELGYVEEIIGKDQPISILVSQDSGDYPIYMIVQNIGNNHEIGRISGYKISLDRKKITYYQTTNRDHPEGDSRKDNVMPLGPDKGMVGRSEEVEFRQHPSLIGRLWQYIFSGKTFDGRLLEKGDDALKSSAFFGIRRMKANLFFDNKNGVPVPKEDLNINFNGDANHTGFTLEEFNELMSHLNVSNLWEYVANGTKTIYKDTPANKKRNELMRRFACEFSEARNGVNPNALFGSVVSSVPLSYFFSDDPEMQEAVKKAQFLSLDIIPENERGILRNFTFNEYIEILSISCNDFVDSPFNPSNDNKIRVMNSNGEIWDGVDENGEPVYSEKYFIDFTTLNHSDFFGNVPTNSSFGKQQINRMGMSQGLPHDPMYIELVKRNILASFGDLSGYEKLSKDEEEQMLEKYRQIAAVKATEDSGVVHKTWIERHIADQYTLQINATKKTYDYCRETIIETKGSEKKEYKPGEYNDSDGYVKAKQSFANLMGADYVSDELFMAWVKSWFGFSYCDGDGMTSLNIDTITQCVNDLWATYRSTGYIYIEARLVSGLSGKIKRPSISRLPQNLALASWESFPNLRKAYSTNGEENYFSFLEKMKDENVKSLNNIRDINTSVNDGGSELARQDALRMLQYYISKTYGEPVPPDSPFYGILAKNVETSMNNCMLNFVDEEEGVRLKEFLEQSKEARRRSLETTQRELMRNMYTVEDETEQGGGISVYKSTRKNDAQKLINTAVELIQVNAVFGFGLPVANLYEGGFRGLAMSLASNFSVGQMSYTHRTIGGKKGNEFYHIIAQDQRCVQLLKALILARQRGDAWALIHGLQEGEDLETVFDNLYGNDKWFARLKNKVFQVTSMDTVFIHQQLENFFKCLDTYITADNVPYWTDIVQDGKTGYEMEIRRDPYQFMLKAISDDSIIKDQFLSAVNSANRLSVSQENVVSIIVGHICKKSSIVNGLSALTIGPFLRYSTNLTGRVLNWFLPMSTISYVLREHLGNESIFGTTFKDMGIDTVRFHTELKYAILADACHMAFPIVAAIILALGLIEYPDDDDKKGNYREYLIGGMRVNETYILTDLTGPIIPYACYLKTLMDGNPRLDVLFNGLGDIASRNPVLPLGEILNVMTGIDDMPDGWEDESESYSKAFGGAPNAVEMMKSKANAALWSTAGRIVTPLFIRELGKMYSTERSYKRVWADGVETVDVDNGISGKTVRVSYNEAMLRKVSRDNPIIGIILNIWNNADTSYTAATSMFAKKEMPETVYYDETQLEVAKLYSVRVLDPETGKYIDRPEQEMDAIALNIIATLQTYNDMEELYNSGFMIDNYTRKYVGQKIWDLIAQAQTEYYTWANSADGNNYVLGDGDFQVGASIKQDRYNYLQQIVSYWKDFYYNKLNSEQLKRGIQKYARENVEYWQDDNGNWYASGFSRSMNPLNYVTGLKLAPGNIESKQGTLGYYGDWDTPSAVIPEISAGGRSLIPLDVQYESTIPLENLADNNEEAAQNLDKSRGTNIYTTSSGSGKSGRSSGGGGGGGGGGSRSIYSHPGNINVPSAKVASTSNPNESRFDYLRPGFETKGSRKASRRSDF